MFALIGGGVAVALVALGLALWVWLGGPGFDGGAGGVLALGVLLLVVGQGAASGAGLRHGSWSTRRGPRLGVPQGNPHGSASGA